MRPVARPGAGEGPPVRQGAGGIPVLLSDYDYPLPPERIAQEPVTPRDSSRLMVLDRRRGSIAHRRFRDLPELLGEGDLLVLNDTRVLRARLEGRKPTGGRVEFLFVRQGRDPGTWEVLCDGARELRTGMILDFGEGFAGEVRGRIGEAVLLGFPGGTDVSGDAGAAGSDAAASLHPPGAGRSPAPRRRREIPDRLRPSAPGRWRPPPPGSTSLPGSSGPSRKGESARPSSRSTWGRGPSCR